MPPRPTTTITYAQSIDGRIATRTGDSQWISGDETLVLAHELRRDSDAILVGIGTVLRDNPELTCRLPDCRSPLRVVLDGSLRIPVDCKISRTASLVETVVFCRAVAANADGPDGVAVREKILALESLGVQVELIECPSGQELPLLQVLARLTNRGISTLMVEGGAHVITSFFRSELVDRLVLVSAPLVIGSGTEAVGELGVQSLADSPRGTTVSVQQIGNDIVWTVDFTQGGME